MTPKQGAIAAALVAVAIAVAAAFWNLQPAAKDFQPRKAVFVNETGDHKHDRTLQASARFFQERTGINLGIVLEDKLPPLTTIEMRADELFARLALGRKSDGKALLFLWSEAERLLEREQQPNDQRVILSLNRAADALALRQPDRKSVV